MKYCVKCRNEMQDEMTVCEKCGYNEEKNENGNKQTAAAMPGIIKKLKSLWLPIVCIALGILSILLIKIWIPGAIIAIAALILSLVALIQFKRKNIKTKLIMIGAIVSVIGLAVNGISGAMYFTSAEYKISRALKHNDINAVIKYYGDVKDYSVRSDVNEKIKEQINDAVQKYADGVIAYDDVKSNLELMSGKFTAQSLETDLQNVLNSVEKLKTSKEAFSAAKQKEEESDIIAAIENYKKVIAEDTENYAAAEERVEALHTEVKPHALSLSEEKASQNDYAGAVEILDKALAILPNDTDLMNAKAGYEDKASAQKLEQLKNEQQVVATNPRIRWGDERWTALYPPQYQADVINNTDKIIKSYDISFLSYNAEGLPLKVKSQYSGSSFEIKGTNDNANIQAGATDSRNYGWDMDYDSIQEVATIYVCISDVTYYDGTTWHNPYYDEWIKIYRGNPIK